MAYEAWGNVYKGDSPGVNPRIEPMWEYKPGEYFRDDEPLPDPFGSDQFDRVQRPTKGKEFLNSFLIAQNPSFDIGAGHRGVSRNAKIHNLTRNNPNLKEVEAAKQMLGGVRLPTF